MQGRSGILYTYNNGRLAADPKLVCQNFLNALERIPKVIETHERELAKTKEQIPVFEAAASGVWRKEDELPTLKRNAAELDRKIALSLKKDEAKEDEAAIGKQVSVLEPPATKAERPLPGNETKLRVR